MSALLATVYLSAELRTATSRDATQKDVDVIVGLQKRLTQACDPASGTDTTELDALADLAEQVAQFFEARDGYDGDLLDSGGARVGTWVETQCDPVYDPADLLQRRTFTGVVTITFRHFA